MLINNTIALTGGSSVSASVSTENVKISTSHQMYAPFIGKPLAKLPKEKKVKKSSISKATFIERLDLRPLTFKGFEKRTLAIQKAIARNLVYKYQYTEIGNRLTGETATDFVSDGYLSLLNHFAKYGELGLGFDCNALTYNGQSMTQGDYFRLLYKAAKQRLMKGNRKSLIRKNGEIVGQISVGSIEMTDDGGVATISNEVELALQRRNSIETIMTIDVVKNEAKAQLAMADGKLALKFWDIVCRVLEVETSEKTADLACLDFGFENKSQFYVAKKRMLENDRLLVLRQLRGLTKMEMAAKLG